MICCTHNFELWMLYEKQKQNIYIALTRFASDASVRRSVKFNNKSNWHIEKLKDKKKDVTTFEVMHKPNQNAIFLYGHKSDIDEEKRRRKNSQNKNKTEQQQKKKNNETKKIKIHGKSTKYATKIKIFDPVTNWWWTHTHTYGKSYKPSLGCSGVVWLLFTTNAEFSSFVMLM